MLGLTGFIKKKLDMEGKLPDKWKDSSEEVVVPVDPIITVNADGTLTVLANKVFTYSDERIEYPYYNEPARQYYFTENAIAADGQELEAPLLHWIENGEHIQGDTNYYRKRIWLLSEYEMYINESSRDAVNAILAENNYELELYAYQCVDSYYASYQGIHKAIYQTVLEIHIPGHEYSSNMGTVSAPRRLLGTVTVAQPGSTDYTLKVIGFKQNPDFNK